MVCTPAYSFTAQLNSKLTELVTNGLVSLSLCRWFVALLEPLAMVNCKLADKLSAIMFGWEVEPVSQYFTSPRGRLLLLKSAHSCQQLMAVFVMHEIEISKIETNPNCENVTIKETFFDANLLHFCQWSNVMFCVLSHHCEIEIIKQ